MHRHSLGPGTLRRTCSTVLLGLVAFVASVGTSLDGDAADSQPMPFRAVVTGLSSDGLDRITTPTFQNPVAPFTFADPQVLNVGGTYYVFGTNGNGRHIQVATSRDLISWRLEGDAMPVVAGWMDLVGHPGGIWAPEVQAVGSQFLMYYAGPDGVSNRQCIGLATSDSILGPYVDHSDRPFLCPPGEFAIDPYVVTDEGGRYIYFANGTSYCSQPTYIAMQRLSSDGLSLIGQRMRILKNDTKWEGCIVETPSMVRYGAKYYLFYSGNDARTAAEGVGYAVCDKVDGPCLKAQENPILATKLDSSPHVWGPAGQDVRFFGGAALIFYIARIVEPDGTFGPPRRLFMDRIVWVDGKPRVVGPTVSSQPAP